MAGEKELARWVIELDAEVKGLKSKLSTGTKQTQSFGSKTKKTLSAVKGHWIAIAAAIGGTVYAINKVTKAFTSFEHKLREVNTLMGKSEASLSRYRDGILKITREVPQSANELTSALYDIVSAGVESGKALDVLATSSKAAVAGVTDTKTAAKTAISVINAYGKDIGEIDKVYDTLFQTVKEGVTTFPELSASIGKVLPVAKAADVEFSNVAASIATMTKSGINSEETTTALMNAIYSLNAPADKAAETMKEMGITWEGWIPTLKQIADKGLSLNQMRQLIPEKRAAKAVLALANNFDTLNNTLEGMDESTGAMRDAYDEMMKSPENQIKLLANAFNELSVEIGKALTPALLDIMKDMRDTFNEWQEDGTVDSLAQAFEDLAGAFSKIFTMGMKAVGAIADMRRITAEKEKASEMARVSELKMLGQYNDIVGVKLEWMEKEAKLKKELNELENLYGTVTGNTIGITKSDINAKKRQIQVQKDLVKYANEVLDVYYKQQEAKGAGVTPTTPETPTTTGKPEPVEGQAYFMGPWAGKEEEYKAEEEIAEKSKNVWEDFFNFKDKLRQEDLEKERRQKELMKSLWSTTFGEISQLMDAFYQASGERLKGFFIFSRAAAAAQATINAFQAFTKGMAVEGKGATAIASLRFAATMAKVGAILGTSIGQTFAEGGMVGGKSGVDQNLAWVTKGEYIHNPKAANYYGNDAMEAINRRAIPKSVFDGFKNKYTPTVGHGAFANGGSVGDNIEPRDINIVNVPDPSLLDSYISSSEGRNALLNVISERPYEFQTALKGT